MNGTDKKYYDYGMPMTKEYEGFGRPGRPGQVYTDTTGNPTVGWGFNLNDPEMRKHIPVDVISGKRALTEEEAQPIFMQRYTQAAKDAVSYLGADNILKLDPERQAILVDMAYNLGATKLSEFVKMREAILAGDYQRAASEMKDSKWYKQTGRRAKQHVLKFGAK